MATIKQIYGTEQSITVTTLVTLAADAKVIYEIDNSSNLHIADDYDVDVAGGDSTGTLDIYRAGSNVTSNVPGTADNLDLWTIVGSIDMSSTMMKIDFRLEQLKKFNSLLFHNTSGSALSAATVKRMGADLTNA